MKVLHALGGLVLLLGCAGLFGATSDISERAIAAVIAADNARGAALLAADTAALGRLLADDLRYTHSTGKIETKAIHLATITNGLRYEKFVTSDLQGQLIAPGVVVLTGKMDQRKNTNGKISAGILMFHAVWRDDAGGWRLVSMQTAVIPPS